MTVCCPRRLQSTVLYVSLLCLALAAHAQSEEYRVRPLRVAQTDSSAPAESSAPVEPTAKEPTPAEPTPAAKKKPLDVKNVFRNICGFCHENYGRTAAKGPQLMNSARTDEFLFNRIKRGMPGRMAAWGSIYSDDDIRQIIKFIRSLKPDEEPKNP